MNKSQTRYSEMRDQTLNKEIKKPEETTDKQIQELEQTELNNRIKAFKKAWNAKYKDAGNIKTRHKAKKE